MREIKFRGKRKDNGEWVYGYYYKNPYNQKVYIIDLKDSGIFPVGNIIPGIVGYHEVFPETVGQYTGLKDKAKWEELRLEQREWLDKGKTKEEWEGKEIYEWDIVKKVSHDGFKMWSEIKEPVGMVKFKNGCFVVGEMDVSLRAVRCKIIGNVSDNLWLLKEKGK